MMGRVVAIIPARYASERLPGKPLISLAGKPMIQWVYEKALQIPAVEEVLVATDDQRIEEAVLSFGGKVSITPQAGNGTERVGFLSRDLDADIIVNLQGDEPLIVPEEVGRAVEVLEEDPRLNVATLGGPLETAEDWRNPAVVKVVVDAHDNALYFSRAPIPAFRASGFRALRSLMRHAGVYVYRASFLQRILEWPETPLERCEKLEQLRILEHGENIRVIRSAKVLPGVDIPDDVEKVSKLLEKIGGRK